MELEFELIEEEYKIAVNENYNSNDTTTIVLLELLTEMLEELRENKEDYAKYSYNYGIVCSMYKILEKIR